ncbi:chorismate mutase [Pseudopedobacter beijingensis]|uniref:chorismate mutase n=1 Tax=Pseudopedobacter beijingensis TaxID=1207056 RepID=A0ABW4IBZ3_9SPHI
MNPQDCNTLAEIRGNIDQIDREIIGMLAKRYGFVQKAAEFKKDEAGVKAADRVKDMLKTRRIWAEEENISPDLIEKIYANLVSCFIQEELNNWKTKQ